MLFSTMILDSLPPRLAPRIALAQITILVIILAVRYVRSPWRKVPPGPKGLPIIGNALQLQDKGWMFEKDNKRNFSASNTIITRPVIPGLRRKRKNI
jgi:hypothetical protein